MNHTIEGKYPVLRCNLNRGETILCSAGNMSWVTDGLSLETSSRGGLFKGLTRAMTGEGVFQNRYRANEDGQEIAFAASLPGEIIHIEMRNQTVIAQKSAFIASSEQIDFEVVFTELSSVKAHGFNREMRAYIEISACLVCLLFILKLSIHLSSLSVDGVI